eukprot:m.212323 g.212323  ORF g.212323 m.212323 type:complete len:1730 (-) comp18585_c3_seq7:223-5412(-)
MVMEEKLLFVHTFAHRVVVQKDGALPVVTDAIRFRCPVRVSEVRVLPQGFCPPPKYKDSSIAGATVPRAFALEIYAPQGLQQANCHPWATLAYDERQLGFSVRSADAPGPTDHLVFRGRYAALTICVFGTTQIMPPAASPVVPTAAPEAVPAVPTAGSAPLGLAARADMEPTSGPPAAPPSRSIKRPRHDSISQPSPGSTAASPAAAPPAMPPPLEVARPQSEDELLELDEDIKELLSFDPFSFEPEPPCQVLMPPEAGIVGLLIKQLSDPRVQEQPWGLGWSPEQTLPSNGEIQAAGEALMRAVEAQGTTPLSGVLPMERQLAWLEVVDGIAATLPGALAWVTYKRLDGEEVSSALVLWATSATDLTNAALLDPMAGVRSFLVGLALAEVCWSSNHASAAWLLRSGLQTQLTEMLADDEVVLPSVLQLKVIEALDASLDSPQGMEHFLGWERPSPTTEASPALDSPFQLLVTCLLRLRSARVAVCMSALLKKAQVYAALAALQIAAGNLPKAEDPTTSDAAILSGTAALQGVSEAFLCIKEAQLPSTPCRFPTSFDTGVLCAEDTTEPFVLPRWLFAMLNARRLIPSLTVCLSSLHEEDVGFAALRDLVLLLLQSPNGLRYLAAHPHDTSIFISTLQALDDQSADVDPADMLSLHQYLQSAGACTSQHLALLLVHHLKAVRCVDGLLQIDSGLLASAALSSKQEVACFSVMMQAYSMLNTPVGKASVSSVLGLCGALPWLICALQKPQQKRSRRSDPVPPSVIRALASRLLAVVLEQDVSGRVCLKFGADIVKKTSPDDTNHKRLRDWLAVFTSGEPLSCVSLLRTVGGCNESFASSLPTLVSCWRLLNVLLAAQGMRMFEELSQHSAGSLAAATLMGAVTALQDTDVAPEATTLVMELLPPLLSVLKTLANFVTPKAPFPGDSGLLCTALLQLHGYCWPLLAATMEDDQITPGGFAWRAWAIQSDVLVVYSKLVIHEAADETATVPLLSKPLTQGFAVSTLLAHPFSEPKFLAPGLSALAMLLPSVTPHNLAHPEALTPAQGVWASALEEQGVELARFLEQAVHLSGSTPFSLLFRVITQLARLSKRVTHHVLYAFVRALRTIVEPMQSAATAEEQKKRPVASAAPGVDDCNSKLATVSRLLFAIRLVCGLPYGVGALTGPKGVRVVLPATGSAAAAPTFLAIVGRTVGHVQSNCLELLLHIVQGSHTWSTTNRLLALDCLLLIAFEGQDLQRILGVCVGAVCEARGSHDILAQGCRVLSVVLAKDAALGKVLVALNEKRESSGKPALRAVLDSLSTPSGEMNKPDWAFLAAVSEAVQLLGSLAAAALRDCPDGDRRVAADLLSRVLHTGKDNGKAAIYDAEAGLKAASDEAAAPPGQDAVQAKIPLSPSSKKDVDTSVLKALSASFSTAHKDDQGSEADREVVSTLEMLAKVCEADPEDEIGVDLATIHNPLDDHALYLVAAVGCDFGDDGSVADALVNQLSRGELLSLCTVHPDGVNQETWALPINLQDVACKYCPETLAKKAKKPREPTKPATASRTRERRKYTSLSGPGLQRKPNRNLRSARDGSRRDGFRNRRKDNISRPPSMHVDDFMLLELSKPSKGAPAGAPPSTGGTRVRNSGSSVNANARAWYKQSHGQRPGSQAPPPPSSPGRYRAAAHSRLGQLAGHREGGQRLAQSYHFDAGSTHDQPYASRLRRPPGLEFGRGYSVASGRDETRRVVRRSFVR